MLRSTAADSVPGVPPPQRPDADLIVDAVRQRAAGSLVESMLHDVRNPLNALAINLEVLTEKLRAETGTVPATQEKNLKAMREQIQRADSLLRTYSDFLIARPDEAARAPLSGLLQATLDVLAPEVRRKRIKLQVALESDVRAAGDGAAVRFLCVQTLLRAIHRSEASAEVRVTLRRSGDDALLEIDDDDRDSAVPSPDIEAALRTVAERLGGRIEMKAGRCSVVLPLAAS